jgi:hypothetical protein
MPDPLDLESIDKALHASWLCTGSRPVGRTLRICRYGELCDIGTAVNSILFLVLDTAAAANADCEVYRASYEAQQLTAAAPTSQSKNQ